MKCSVGLMRHPGIFLGICVQNEWQTAIMLSGGCNPCSQEDVRSPDLAIRFLSCGRRDGDTSYSDISFILNSVIPWRHTIRIRRVLH